MTTKESIIQKYWPKPSESDSVPKMKSAIDKMMDEYVLTFANTSQLSKLTGIKYQTLYKRINTLKWDVSIAISTPLKTPRAYKKIIKKLSNGNSSGR